MELTEQMLDEIADVFRGVIYGRITFKISPENKTLDYTVETSHRISIEPEKKKPKKYRGKHDR